MKKIFYITFLLFICSCIACGSNDNKNNVTNSNNVCKPSYIYVTVRDTDEINKLRKQLISAQDSVKMYRDSIYYADYINARRIEKIKYYIKICDKRSKNKKYFFGWIKRIMAE